MRNLYRIELWICVWYGVIHSCRVYSNVLGGGGHKQQILDFNYLESGPHPPGSPDSKTTRIISELRIENEKGHSL